ncbi:MAG: hypothetical protein J2P24_12105 [Streptosporangiales bacterium]|nr:hypothetical protein [Streptosporangiales bacterium]MBO0889916.1 hypothetical protein [Acidothermales bacterium]
MSESREQRRGNGVDADEYAFVGTATRAVSDGMLRELADEGVAAYAVAAGGRSGDERLYVDRMSFVYARRLLRRHLDDAARGDDDDAAWERVVADFHAEPAEGSRPWPEAEDIGDDDRPKPRSRVVRVRLDRDEPDDEEETDDEEHFVRPNPPELPRGDLLTKVAWAAMLVAVAYPIVSKATGWPLPGWAIALAVVVFIGGIVIHVVRIRDPRKDEPGSDDGAVV